MALSGAVTKGAGLIVETSQEAINYPALTIWAVRSRIRPIYTDRVRNGDLAFSQRIRADHLPTGTLAHLRRGDNPALHRRSRGSFQELLD